MLRQRHRLRALVPPAIVGVLLALLGLVGGVRFIPPISAFLALVAGVAATTSP